MFARVLFTKVLPQYIEQHRQVYNKEIIPVVQQQKGLVSVMLLEPANKKNDVLFVTGWESRDDADAYERSELYEELLDKVRDLMVADPVLKTYTVETVEKEKPFWVGEDSQA